MSEESDAVQGPVDEGVTIVDYATKYREAIDILKDVLPLLDGLSRGHGPDTIVQNQAITAKLRVEKALER